jgi:transcription elongation GreA/GreB family factor
VDEADPSRGLISIRSPLAAAIIGARTGEVVEADAPLGEIEIVGVE